MGGLAVGSKVKHPRLRGAMGEIEALWDETSNPDYLGVVAFCFWSRKKNQFTPEEHFKSVELLSDLREFK